MSEGISIYQDGSGLIIVLPSFTIIHGHHTFGHILVRIEKLADDLFVTHECPLMQRGDSCDCVKPALDIYLHQTQEAYEDVILEQRKVKLKPTMTQLI
ncbi:hypothetical protein [Salibacterium aidingense]|uniref:hypothetical protein n=1 Tax=Salibacterium aidingense TaxID=384933 RepID=UPI000423DF69|nr:hypothetical protein [Salibacterium aidingense]